MAWACALAGVLVLGAVALRPPTAPTAASETSLWLTGSSLAVGSPAAPYAAMDRLGWRGTVRVLPGAGYARGGAGSPTLPAAARREPGLAAYDVVVLQGGEADNTASVEEIEVAVQHLVDHLRAQTRARIVLVGPVPARLPAPLGQRRVSAALQAAASTRDVPYLDPLRRAWTDADPELGDSLAAALTALLEQPADVGRT